MSSWFSCIFGIERPEGKNTRWWIDLFLFDTIVRDCITTYEASFDIWRIHRRSADDESGHQFSFYFYTSHEIFQAIESLVVEHEALKVLKSANLLHELLNQENGSAIEATCDPTWPLPLRKAWPYYIMGVSQMALELVEQLRPSTILALDGIPIKDYETYYTQVMNNLNEVWQKRGSHAFFHHINAIFGYTPIIAQPRSISGVLAVF